MGHRVPLARKFNVDHHCNVFMLSYRGCVLALIPVDHGSVLEHNADTVMSEDMAVQKVMRQSWVRTDVTCLTVFMTDLLPQESE